MIFMDLDLKSQLPPEMKWIEMTTEKLVSYQEINFMNIILTTFNAILNFNLVSKENKFIEQI